LETTYVHVYPAVAHASPAVVPLHVNLL